MEYTATTHWALTVIGLALLMVLVLTLRFEVSYLAQQWGRWFQLSLSLVSIGIMVVLSFTCLFHWSLAPVFVFTVILLLFPLLLLLAPAILLLRARSFANIAKERMKEQRELVKEVQDIIDERKRQKIREKKAERGE